MLIALMAGCATGGTTAPAASGPPANVAGSWSGSFGVGATGGSMSMSLQQTGNQVKGEIDIGGRPDMSGPITGTVSGDTIQVGLTSGYGTSSLLTVKGDQITGVYQGGPIMLRRSK
ncbi:MAG: hypothetical protein ACRELS_07025 [Candidatus Rokuibacteriota bacterium]